MLAVVVIPFLLLTPSQPGRPGLEEGLDIDRWFDEDNEPVDDEDDEMEDDDDWRWQERAIRRETPDGTAGRPKSVALVRKRGREAR